ncbi:uncharacterized protein LOC128725016 [Anopheles nili]|uniref:uncharacterized protein LOC128725016 n=1 Tax=Anopheles nili TaxID=185578 RepID=UPI00237B735B|nr:uncharacterized protein LOC128725016 [Anopheles nili]
MVYIHGGGFMSGSGSSLFYNPEYFIQQDVLVVTINYRLGPLGFLSLPSAGIAGNAGLKDQLLALKWVHENIAQFGGDPGNVTLFGESAGSMSSYLHYLSPNSQKYIHRVICQSGVAVSDSFFQVEPEEKARKLARFFGYTGDSDQGVLETLEKVPAKELAKHQNIAISEAEKQLSLIFIFRPVVEQQVTDDSIITQHPRDILKTHDALQMPLLEGCNSGEGILALRSLGNRWRAFGRSPERFVPVLLGRSPDLDRVAVGREIQRFYFGDRPVDDRSIDAMCDVMSDNTFITNSVTNAEWLARYQRNVRHFHYRFTYDGRFSVLKRIFLLSNVTGACHADDTMYMFNPCFLPTVPASSDECKVRNIFIALWTSFARHGDPTAVVPTNLVPVKWQPVAKVGLYSPDDFTLDCFQIDTVPRMVKNPGAGRIQLWRRLLKKYRPDYLYTIASNTVEKRCIKRHLAHCLMIRKQTGSNLYSISQLVDQWSLFANNSPSVHRQLIVRQGQLRGVSSTLPNGGRYHYFKGIPYAKPPVGRLRFKAPVPLERFRKPVLDCYAERADSIQFDFFSGFIFGSECGLYLNVYTPQLPEEPRTYGFAVMVFLHGGGFSCGSGSSLFYNPEYFLQRGVIVVTINYRLGPFGFLHLPEAGVEGNAGLKDQLMALRWINENIAQFGGDPNNVTLFGESAGSFSVYLHMLSPNSSKYFHRAICQSGVVCSSSFMQTNPLEMAFNLARYFGYTGESQQEALETLQQVPPKLLAKHQRKALGQDNYKQRDLVFVFLPVVEQTLTDDSIITQSPEVILKSYDTLRMPLLEGCNDAEGILGLFILNQQIRIGDIHLMPERMSAKIFPQLSPAERTELAKKVCQFYFADSPPTAWSADQIKHLLTDTIFLIDSTINAEWLARYQPNLRHYHYRFTFDGRFSLLKRLFHKAIVSGACHGDDTLYMFNPKFLPNLGPSSDECRVRDNFVALWTSFAKHGDPSVDSRDIVDVQWRPVEKIKRDSHDDFRINCLEINVQPAMIGDPCQERTRFWRNLLKTHRKGFL